MDYGIWEEEEKKLLECVLSDNENLNEFFPCVNHMLDAEEYQF